MTLTAMEALGPAPDEALMTLFLQAYGNQSRGGFLSQTLTHLGEAAHVVHLLGRAGR